MAQPQVAGRTSRRRARRCLHIGAETGRCRLVSRRESTSWRDPRVLVLERPFKAIPKPVPNHFTTKCTGKPQGSHAWGFAYFEKSPNRSPKCSTIVFKGVCASWCFNQYKQMGYKPRVFVLGSSRTRFFVPWRRVPGPPEVFGAMAKAG